MKSIEKEFNNNQAIIYLEVEVEDDGLRLDEAIKLYLKSQSRQVIKKMIANKQIVIESRETKNSAHTRVRHLDTIKVFRDNHEKVQKNIRIIFEDEFLIAINKSKGMPVHPTGVHHFNVASVLVEEYLKEKVYPIHRLDIKTSGVVLFAKTKEMATLMRGIFDNKEIIKTYEFESHIETDIQLPFEVELALSRDEESEVTLKQQVDRFGQSSLTLFESLNYTKEKLSGTAIPVTGRLHQIRCHLAFSGYPIIGDDIYGQCNKEDQLKLHCKSLSFLHPILKKQIQIHI